MAPPLLLNDTVQIDPPSEHSFSAMPTFESPSNSSSSSSSRPALLHSLQHGSSVLALAVSPETSSIYAGTQDGEIVVWSLETYIELRRVQAHKRSVLSLCLASPPPTDAKSSRSLSSTTPSTILISTAGDPVINIWCPRTLARLYEIYSIHDVGDIFSVAYSPQWDTIFVGAQNTSIQCACLSDPRLRVSHDSARHPDRRNHRFFDSKAVGGTSTPRRSDERWGFIPRARSVLEMEEGSVRNFAHYGYVYCMLMARGPTVLVDADEDVLISGGGDGTIKLWRIIGDREKEASLAAERTGGRRADVDSIEEIVTLGTDDAESILSLAIDGSFLYAGKLEGIIELWDLDTKQKLRVIKAHQGDVMAVQMAWGYLWSASAAGSASNHSTVHYDKYHKSTGHVSQKYQCLNRWKAHDGKILACAATTFGDNHMYITGANDNTVSVWKVPDSRSATSQESSDEMSDTIFSSLSEFVSYKTVSSRPEYAEDCRRGATFLGTLFKKFGGQVEMLNSDQANNPVVLATFSGKLEPAEKRKRILFYGHYDVVPADERRGKWLTDPFQLRGLNGYLYGRGVSDNKGPVIAALYAVSDLMQAKSLDNDVVFVIEGEEESGSRGFQETIRRHKALIGRADYILLANSYWLDDSVPCLTYGLRGVLHATIQVQADQPDRHSGVDGSYMVDEPLSDLTAVLSKLKGSGNRIMIPGFYDCVGPLTAEEVARYDDIVSILIRRAPQTSASPARLKESLMARWREPNLTIHRYKVSGPDGSLMSSQASANISLRLVPRQELDEVAVALGEFLERQFAELKSSNMFKMRVDNRAEPWLGEPGNGIFQALERAVMEAWKDCFDGGDGTPGAALPSEGDSPQADSGATGTRQRTAEEQGEDEAEDARGDDGANASETTTVGAAVAGGSGINGLSFQKPKRPLYIREGGSIPAIRFLEKEFGAPAAHLPCGQATDSAHLDNERLRVINLLKSREIFANVFGRL